MTASARSTTMPPTSTSDVRLTKRPCSINYESASLECRRDTTHPSSASGLDSCCRRSRFAGPLAVHSRVRPRIRKEQLLSADLVGSDRILTLARNQPVDELLGELPFDVRMLLRIDEHQSILIEQPAVAFDDDHELATIFERQPRPAIRKDIGVHRGRCVQRRSHAGA